jgi:hypothetical protein
LLYQHLKFLRNVVTTQCEFFLAVNENGGCRGFSGARQADTDVGMLTLSGSVDDADLPKY